MQFNVVDSSGWIEYFQDTDRADVFEPAILDIDNLVVPAVSIYEVHKRLSQLSPKHIVDECIEAMQKARVVELTAERAIAASIIAVRHQLAMADAMMYAIATEFDAMFYTQDIDYKDLPNVAVYVKT